jgi:uncharacterized protein YqgV (UPF0045/DUF77 family)
MTPHTVLKLLVPAYVKDYMNNIQRRLEALESQPQRLAPMQTTISVLEVTLDQVMRIVG